MTQTLSAERYRAATNFIEREGRPLEVTLLRQGLTGGGTDAVFAALAPFQNPDGGFGHGLEPDTSSPASTAIATSIALRLLIRLGATADHPMVMQTLGWLEANFDRDAGVWPIVGPGVEDAPHAPWWGWSQDMVGSDSLAGAKLGFRFNPTAEIMGQLYHYRSGVPAWLIGAAEERMGATLAEFPLIESAYDLKCAIRLAEGAATPPSLREQASAAVRRSVAAHDPNDEHAPVLRRSGRGPGRGSHRGPDRRPAGRRRLDDVLGLGLRRRRSLGQGQTRLARLDYARGDRDVTGLGKGGELTLPHPAHTGESRDERVQ
jgi:hypothetical protein